MGCAGVGVPYWRSVGCGVNRHLLEDVEGQGAGTDGKKDSRDGLEVH